MLCILNLNTLVGTNTVSYVSIFIFYQALDFLFKRSTKAAVRVW